jgi:hypothetical protein
MTALQSAIKLHDFIRSNAGETSDWPLQITSTESGTLDELDRLLKDFRDRAMQETA